MERQRSSDVDALHSAAVDFRKVAADALGQTQDAQAVEPLVAALCDASWGVRRAAADALGEVPPWAVEPLKAAAEDRGSSVRRAAVDALAAMASTVANRVWRIRPGQLVTFGGVRSCARGRTLDAPQIPMDLAPAADRREDTSIGLLREKYMGYDMELVDPGNTVTETSFRLSSWGMARVVRGHEKVPAGGHGKVPTLELI
jgi:hypothetical protein